MNLKKLRTITAVLLCAALLAGCGSAAALGPASPAPTAAAAAGASDESPWQAAFVRLQDSSLTSQIKNGIAVGDELFFTAFTVLDDRTPEGVTPEWPEQYWVYGPVVCRVGLDGSVDKLPYVPETESDDVTVSFDGLCAGADGTLWVLEKHSRFVNAADAENLQSTESFLLAHIGADGGLLARFELDGLREHADIAERNDGSYSFSVTGMAAHGDDGVCLALDEFFFGNFGSSSETRVCVLDAATGSPVKTVTLDSTPEKLCALADGRLALLSYEGGSERVGLLDLEAGRIENAVPVSGYPDCLTAAGGSLYYSEGDSFYRLDPTGGESEKLFSWLGCDVSHGRDSSVAVLADGRVVTVTGAKNTSAADNELAVLSPAAPGAGREKKVLRLAVMNLTSWTSEAVSRFNRSNPDYRIEVTDYSQFNDYSAGANGTNAGVNRLQTEMIAGNMPDIVDVNLLSVDRLGAKGLILDLYPFIEADPKLGREALLGQVLKAFEENGKLYQTVSNFYVLTAAGLSERVGDEMGWTVEQFTDALQALRAENPDATAFEGYLTRDTALTFQLYLEMENYVDWAEGKAHFDTDGFQHLLEYVKSVPAAFDFVSADRPQEDDEALLAGLQLVKRCTFSSFESVQENTVWLGGAPVTFVGYPTESGVGSMFAQLGSSFAITAACADPDAAWQFVRQFFLPEIQRMLTSGAFPTNCAVYEEMKTAAVTPQFKKNDDGSYALDAEGRRMEIDRGSAYLGTVSVPLRTATAAEIALLEQIIASTTHALRLDSSLEEIIRSGAAAYFADQKSVEEVARLIQSKASLYISEQR